MLIVNNTRGARYQPSRSAHALPPHFAYAELEGGTHDIVDVQPDAWCAAVREFFELPE